MTKYPEKYGSIFPDTVNSDSARLKLRVPGPISSPPGMNPPIWYVEGSRCRLLNCPLRINEMAGLNAFAEAGAEALGTIDAAETEAGAAVDAPAVAGAVGTVAGACSIG